MLHILFYLWGRALVEAEITDHQLVYQVKNPFETEHIRSSLKMVQITLIPSETEIFLVKA
jgi:hypothetical protein